MKGALVTGAGQRIGRALAMALAADGYYVFIHHHESAEGVCETVAVIMVVKGKVKVVQANLESARQAESLIDKCRVPGVALTCLVNNASLFKLDRDPAMGASVMITAVTDSGGFFIFLGLATLFLL